MAKRKKVHLICNAHLDPVWLWQWEEGAAEALSTFRVAAELCEKYDTFIFNHNEAILYQWVQEYEPDLFKRIQKLVKAGRWNIMGGWYLQPDCNMPSGESFVRQILYGKPYFQEQFGVDVTTALNFDPFGHTQGLVQILAKSGYDSYLFGRPHQEYCQLPEGPFVWTGCDGSEVIAMRFPGWYNTEIGKAARTIEQRIEGKQFNPFVVLWGIGNHGGGPSKQDLRDITQLIRRRKDIDLHHSTPQAFFKSVRKMQHNLPRRNADINPWAIGCYTSQIRIKQKHRQLENELYSTEKMCSDAWLNGLMDYPQDRLNDVCVDLLRSEFHDALPGSGIESVEEATLRQLDHGLEITSGLKAKAFFALCAGQRKAKDAEVPIFVYNPHPFPIQQTMDCEFQLQEMIWNGEAFRTVQISQNGKSIPAQVEKEHANLEIDWRKRVSFRANLQPGMNRLDCTTTRVKKKPAKKLKPRKSGKILFKTSQIHVEINTRTGLMDRCVLNGKDCLSNGAFLPLVMHDSIDAWEGIERAFSKKAGRFKLLSKAESARFAGVSAGNLQPVRVIEDGDARSVVEALFGYNESRICMRYILPKHGSEFEVELRTYWHEKTRMLKLSLPTKLHDPQYIGQVAYGVGQLPANGDEAVAQKWTAVTSKKDKTALTIINDGTYASSLHHGELRLTLLRSPAYSCNRFEGLDRGLPSDRFSPRIDQGMRMFRFWFNAGSIRSRMTAVDREALAQNEKPFALSFFPPGNGRKPKPLALLEDDSVQIACAKKAENSNDLIVRLFEPTGKRTETTLTIPTLRKRIRLQMDPFEVKTLRINPRSGKYKETDLLEKPIR